MDVGSLGWQRPLRGAVSAVLVAGLLTGSPVAQGSPPRLPPLPPGPPQLGLAPGAEDFDAATLRDEVRRSPLFLAELDHARLIASGPVVVRLQEGVELDLNAYLVGTRILADPALRAVQDQPAALGLVGSPLLRDEVYLLADRIVVSRELIVRVSASTCGWDAQGAGRAQVRTATARARAAAVAEAVERAREELCPLPAGTSITGTVAPPAPGGTPPRSRARREQAMGGGGDLPPPPGPSDIAQAAAAVRAELASLPPQAEFRHGISVAQALAMADEALLRLDMDGEERIFHHVSVIPLDPRAQSTIAAAPVMNIPRARLDEMGRGFLLDRPVGPALTAVPAALVPMILDRPDLMPRTSDRTLIQEMPPDPKVQAPRRRPTPPSLDLQPGQAMPVRRDVNHDGHYYFITGFTLSERIEERRRRTFNKKKNWYVEVGYSLGYQAGLRFPFHVEARLTNRYAAQGNGWRPTETALQIRARGSQQTAEGGSIFQAAGMPPNLWLDDREFTLGAWAGCYFQGRFPIVGTIRINCPSVSVPPAGTCPGWACAHFTPPIGERRLLANPRLPTSVTRLQVSVWFLTGGLEPGVNVYAADGRFLLEAQAREARFVASGDAGQPCRATSANDPAAHNQLLHDRLCRLAFTRPPGAADQVMTVGLVPQGNLPPVVVLAEPVYEFNLEFVPVLTIFALINIHIARWRFDHDIEIPGLAIRQSFGFGRHPGTTASAEKGGCSPADQNLARCAPERGYRYGAVY
jgi:hypothetical protein